MDKPIWPGWETGNRIGRGAFSTVYEIHRSQYGFIEKAALKVITIPHNEEEVDILRVEGLDDESITTRFKEKIDDISKEYRIMIGLKGCLNVVHCEDIMAVRFDEGLGWKIYLKMELLTPLLKAMNSVKSEQQIINFAMDMCNALAYCHKKHVLHRDIKPQNIFVDEENNFKLGDFGVSRIICASVTEGTIGVGTYNYMAPEVMQGNQPYGVAADIYSLGMVLYWLLNQFRGPFLPHPPVPVTNIMEEEARKRRFSGERLPAPTHGSAGLVRIVLKACAFDPSARYSSAREMYLDLKELDDSFGVPDSFPEDDNQTVILEYDPTLETAKMNGSHQKEQIRSRVGTQESTYRTNSQYAKKYYGKKGIALLCIWLALLTGGFLIGSYFAYNTGIDGTRANTQETPIPFGGETEQDCQHIWIPPDCTTPQRCKICGMVSGVALGHQWKNSTSSSPKTCSICGEVDETTLPKTCWNINDIITFGSYEQDGFRANGTEAIEWLVLDVQEDRVLLLSRYALDSMPYNDSYSSTTWKTCTLRDWLNSTFMDTAFTADEKKRIVVGEVDNSAAQGNQKWNIDEGESTIDAVFLLSYAEAERYFYDPAERICKPTSYAISRGADTRILKDGVTTAGWWWLRSPGEKAHHASFVNFDGTCYSNAVGNGYLSVRPALWMKLGNK